MQCYMQTPEAAQLRQVNSIKTKSKIALLFGVLKILGKANKWKSMLPGRQTPYLL